MECPRSRGLLTLRKATLLARHHQNGIIGVYVRYIHELIANRPLKPAAKQM